MASTWLNSELEHKGGWGYNTAQTKMNVEQNLQKGKLTGQIYDRELQREVKKLENIEAGMQEPQLQRFRWLKVEMLGEELTGDIGKGFGTDWRSIYNQGGVVGQLLGEPINDPELKRINGEFITADNIMRFRQGVNLVNEFNQEEMP